MTAWEPPVAAAPTCRPRVRPRPDDDDDARRRDVEASAADAVDEVGRPSVDRASTVPAEPPATAASRVTSSSTRVPLALVPPAGAPPAVPAASTPVPRATVPPPSRSLSTRVLGLFLTPPGVPARAVDRPVGLRPSRGRLPRPERRAPAADAAGARVALLVARAGSGHPAACAVASALADRSRGLIPVVVVGGDLAGTADDGARAPALRLAAAMRQVGLDARARGRHVEVASPTGSRAALAAWERVDAAASRHPVVVLLSGPRGAEDDDLLDRQDDVVAVVPRDAADSLRVLTTTTEARPVRVVAADLPAGSGPPSALVRRHPGLRSVVAAVTGRATPLAARPAGRESGQALLLVLGALLVTITLAAVAGALAAGLGASADDQRAADLAALAAARAMAADYADVDTWQARDVGIAPGPGMPIATYLRRARAAATATAARNGASGVRIAFPGTASGAGGGRTPAAPVDTVPTRVAVTVTEGADAGGTELRAAATAEAELVPPAQPALPFGAGGAGEYTGPLAHRDGKPMRPDVAMAYDRMRAAARADGVSLVVVSGYRSDAEQAVLFARRPDPKWVAPPGQSLHRLGTELDLGPNASWPWLARNARRFGFVQRYSWEPWHFGFVRNPGSASLGYGSGRSPGARSSAAASAEKGVADDRGRSRSGSGGDGRGPSGATLPDWVPAVYRPMLARSAQRWNVGAVLLAAQLKAESNFQPNARSGAGAQGIAQFMPGTARLYGLRDPFDPAAAIDAQAHLMRDLLRDFGSVPLALAAYNAGPGAVRRCGCAGPFAETRAYVAKILAIMLGAGDPLGVGAGALTVRLVR